MAEDFDIRDEHVSKEEKDFENALRPLRFDDFNGQKAVVDNLRVFVEAAKYRGEPLDHTLLYGPPGLGKTTLSNIIANELGVGFKITSGPVLDKPGDLAGILTSRYLPKVAAFLKKPLQWISIAFFIGMVIIAFAGNMDAFLKCVKYIFFVVFIHNLTAACWSSPPGGASGTSCPASPPLSISNANHGEKPKRPPLPLPKAVVRLQYETQL